MEIELARWDFFVSYTKSDLQWAEWIAWQLEEIGYRILIQAWDFVPGSNWVQGLQNGIVAASRTIAVLSSNYLSSVYGSAEWQAAWAADPVGRNRTLLVVRVVDCDRPGLLGGLVSIDLFGLNEAAAKVYVQSMVARAIRGRAKPESEPLFPGTRTAARERAITWEVSFPAGPR